MGLVVELGILDILPRSHGVITKPLAVPTELIISKKNKWHEQWTSNLPLAIREPSQSMLWKPRKSSDSFHILEKNSPDAFHGIFPPIPNAWPTTTWLVNDLTICSVQLVSSFKIPYSISIQPFPNGTRRQWRQFITTFHLPSSFGFQVLAVHGDVNVGNTNKDKNAVNCSVL